jgi:hypothetical protein
LTVELCLSAGAWDFEVTDTFTRADSATSMGDAESGQVWFPGYGVWGISSNQAYLATDAGENVTWVKGLAGGTISVTLATTQDAVGLAFRCQDRDNYWRVQVNSASTRWDLYLVQAGVATLMGNTGTANVSSGAVVMVKAEGDQILVHVDGVLKLTVTDSTFQKASRCGLYAAATGTARFDAFTADFVWTDITAYVTQVTYGRGRQHELDRIEAGTAQITLRDPDRRFEPEHAAGAYYPFIVPMRRIRVQATHTADSTLMWGTDMLTWGGDELMWGGDPVTYGRFYGFVERWPLVWPGSVGEAQVSIEAVDALAIYGLFPSYASTVLGLTSSVHAYYRLGDSPPTDSGPSAFAAGTVTSPAAVSLPGLLPAIAGDNGSVTSSGVTGKVSLPAAAGLTCGTGDFTVTLMAAAVETANVWQYNQPVGTPSVLSLGASSTLFQVNTTQALGPTVLDGDPHHFVLVRRSGVLEIWIDGVLGGTDATSADNMDSPSNIFAPPAGGTAVKTVDEVAWWNRALTVEEIVSLSGAAGCVSSGGQTTGERIALIADLLNFGPSQRQIDTGLSVMQATAFGAQHPRDALNAAVDTEDGLAFIDGDGDLVFMDRNASLAEITHDTWGDLDGSEYHYEVLVPSFDIDRIYNDVRITRTGAPTVTLQDTDSQADYGDQILTRTVEHSTNAEVTTQAQWLLARYKDPHIRVDAIRLRGEMTDWSVVLPRELGDRLTVKRRPATGDPMSIETVISHISETITARDWVTTWRLALLPPVAILNDPVNGVLSGEFVAGWG